MYHEFNYLCTKERIKKEFTTLYTLQQNGISQKEKQFFL